MDKQMMVYPKGLMAEMINLRSILDESLLFQPYERSILLLDLSDPDSLSQLKTLDGSQFVLGVCMFSHSDQIPAESLINAGCYYFENDQLPEIIEFLGIQLERIRAGLQTSQVMEGCLSVEEHFTGLMHKQFMTTVIEGSIAVCRHMVQQAFVFLRTTENDTTLTYEILAPSTFGLYDANELFECFCDTVDPKTQIVYGVSLRESIENSSVIKLIVGVERHLGALYSAKE